METIYEETFPDTGPIEQLNNKELTKDEKEFLTLIDRINKILIETKFDIDLGAECIYKEHCSEVRRQVQLAKETQILNIEVFSKEFMNEIDRFHIIQTNGHKEDQKLSEEKIEFKLLITRMKKTLNQTKFDITDSDFIIHKEHYDELCTKFQIAKETQTQKIEEISNEFTDKIDEFEKVSLKDFSKEYKKHLFSILNNMKKADRKWNKLAIKYKVDYRLLKHARDSLSKIVVHRNNFDILFHNKMLNFKEDEDKALMGELSLISYDSLNGINLKNHFDKLEDEYIREYNLIDFEMNFRFKSGKILSNGDLLLCGVIDDQFRAEYSVVLLVFDLKRNILKTVKKLNNWIDSVVFSSDKICITYRFKNKSLFQKDFDDSREFEIDPAINKVEDLCVILILNEKLRILHRFIRKSIRIGKLIGANDSFLFFTDLKGFRDGKVGIRNWSMVSNTVIGQNKDSKLPYYFDFHLYNRKLSILFGKYYFLSRDNSSEDTNLKIVDEKTGKLVKVIENVNDFFIDMNYNLVVSNRVSIRYFSFNREFLKEVITGKDVRFILNNNISLSAFNAEDKVFYFSTKYDKNTNEVIKI